MHRGNVAGKDKRETVSSTPRLALSIAQFCQAHNISEAFFYKLKRQGIGPREMKLGTRTLITFEAAAKWRAAREATRPAEATVSARRSVKSGEAHD